jgi:stage II sporulation protein D
MDKRFGRLIGSLLVFLLLFTSISVGQVLASSHDGVNLGIDSSEIEKVYEEKIMAKDNEQLTIELEYTGRLQMADSNKIYQAVNGKLVEKSLEDVQVGAENVKVFVNQKNKISLIVINEETPVKNMRVGIMTNNFESLDHESFGIKSAGGMVLVDKKDDVELTIDADSTITFTVETNLVNVEQDDKVIYSTTNRLYAFPADELHKIDVTTFQRGGWKKFDPSYRGFFEISISPTDEEKVRVINEIDLEEYLYQVVPSEMPEFFGLNALKAQAVAARTYALSDYYSDRFTSDGFYIVDSVMSQVYNNNPENKTSTQAVNETKGIIMTSDGELVDARYYSTSSGYGASKHEVWSEEDNTFPGVPIPYLIAQSHTFDPENPNKMLELDTSDEKAVSDFFKDLSLTGYDAASPFFRWKIELSKEELQNTINKNLGPRYEAAPDFVLTKDENNDFVSLPIPEEGIGEFVDMYVAKRGAGGNIMDLVIEGTTGTYKVIKEFNIRFVIRPWKNDTGGEDVVLYQAKAASEDYEFKRDNFSIMPSASFSFDISEDQAVTFYGGGFGHGVGMSQYGAYHLGSELGWSFDRILTSYYSSMKLTDVHFEQKTSLEQLAIKAIQALPDPHVVTLQHEEAVVSARALVLAANNDSQITFLSKLEEAEQILDKQKKDLYEKIRSINKSKKNND